MKKYLVIPLIIFFCLHVKAQDLPRAILRGDYPDPSIMREGEDFYMTHSPFVYSPGFLIWHSKDLVNWKPITRAMVDVVGSAMAPDLFKYKDKYYIYFPAAGTNWVIWANTIRGPWSKPIDLKVRRIDPGHAVGEDGKRYLFVSAGGMVPLSDDGLSATGEMKDVYAGWEYPKNWITECMCLESPKITRKGDFYYMITAEGGTAGPATSHMAVVARSKSIFGPWENSPINPLVHTYSRDEKWWSKGHGTLIDDVNGNWWIVYHAYEKGYYTLGRQTLIEPVEWTAEGWPRISQDKKLTTSKGNGLSLSDNFNSKHLNLQWTSWKGYDKNAIRFIDKKLQLDAKGNNPADAQLLLTTATDTSYQVEVEVFLADEGKGGLILFYNDKAYAGIVADEKELTIYEDAKTQKNAVNSFGKHFFLNIKNERQTCDMLVSKNGKDWTALVSGLDVSKLNHNNFGGFFALRPGLVSMGNNKVTFNNFSYKNE